MFDRGEKKIKPGPKSRAPQNIIKRTGGLKNKDLKYDDLKPLYDLWCGYFSQVLSQISEPDERLLKTDFHGCILYVSDSPNPSQIGLHGICLHESKSTFQILSKKNKVLVVQKEHTTFQFVFENRIFTIFGDALGQRSFARGKKFKRYGLVSEKCPKGSTGCRIRISKDSVDFYEYSALYDRNQYVCVHKTEFDGANKSGCIKKRTDHGNEVKSKNQDYDNQRKSKDQDYSVQMKSAVRSTENPKQKAKIHLDDNNEIHVIHIKPEEKNKYERIIESDEFANIVKKVTPKKEVSDDLYDEEELAKLDEEFLERKKQNRPKIKQNKEIEVVRILPQDDDLDDRNKDLGQATGEYFDAFPVDFSPTVSTSISFIIFVFILFQF
ncbi:hypothetical protein FO519_002705 [Halicephalobus sp. NKZ332]|nr:hypothetical protein FO519_002705 [Halicephalobus sp. NKZ332]